MSEFKGYSFHQKLTSESVAVLGLVIISNNIRLENSFTSWLDKELQKINEKTSNDLLEILKKLQLATKLIVCLENVFWKYWSLPEDISHKIYCLMDNLFKIPALQIPKVKRYEGLDNTINKFLIAFRSYLLKFCINHQIAVEWQDKINNKIWKLIWNADFFTSWHYQDFISLWCDLDWQDKINKELLLLNIPLNQALNKARNWIACQNILNHEKFKWIDSDVVTLTTCLNKAQNWTECQAILNHERFKWINSDVFMMNTYLKIVIKVEDLEIKDKLNIILTILRRFYELKVNQKDILIMKLILIRLNSETEFNSDEIRKKGFLIELEKIDYELPDLFNKNNWAQQINNNSKIAIHESNNTVDQTQAQQADLIINKTGNKSKHWLNNEQYAKYLEWIKSWLSESMALSFARWEIWKWIWWGWSHSKKWSNFNKK